MRGTSPADFFFCQLQCLRELIHYDGDAKAKAAGVNIDDADAASVKLRALQKVAKKSFQNQDVIETARKSVKAAIKVIPKMADNEKFLAAPIRSGVLARVLRTTPHAITQYRAAGVHAVKVQTFTKWIAGTLGARG